jgi:hypothetical protein
VEFAPNQAAAGPQGPAVKEDEYDEISSERRCHVFGS